MVAFSTIALADPRPFTFTYDAYPVGKGNAEYEQWVTYRHRTDSDHAFTRFDLRHEIEYGISDNFDISFYFANWRYQDSDSRTGAHYDSSSVETIYYLTNPVTDFLGIGLYNEIAVGDGELEFEQKLILHKDIGNWTLAYNLIFETEVEGVFKKDEDTEVEGVIEHTFGISYGLPKGFHVGAEATIESIYEDWEEYEDTVYYAGPVFGYTSGGPWWVTVTPLFQLSSVDDEPQYEVRMIAGWEF